jgi:hypothetical protein
MYFYLHQKEANLRLQYDMLTMKDIIRDGHPTLRAKAEDVSLPLSDEDKNVISFSISIIR